jgi:hypothetical protein
VETRERLLVHSAALANMQVEKLHVGRYKFYKIKTPAQNMTMPLTISEAESWMNGYLAAAAKVMGALQ